MTRNDLSDHIRAMDDFDSFDMPGGKKVVKMFDRLFVVDMPKTPLTMPLELEYLPPQKDNFQWRMPFHNYSFSFRSFSIPILALEDQRRGRTNCRMRTALRRAKQKRIKMAKVKHDPR